MKSFYLFTHLGQELDSNKYNINIKDYNFSVLQGLKSALNKMSLQQWHGAKLNNSQHGIKHTRKHSNRPCHFHYGLDGKSRGEIIHTFLSHTGFS